MSRDSSSTILASECTHGGIPAAPAGGLKDFGGLITSLTDLERRLAEQDGETFALFYITLQGFFLVNGSYDHRVGNLVLTEMPARLLAWLDGRRGAVAPVGADHFLLLCVGPWDDASVDRAVRELRESLTRPLRDGPLSICFSVSIGVARRDPNGRTDPCSYVRDASAASARPTGSAARPPTRSDRGEGAPTS